MAGVVQRRGRAKLEHSAADFLPSGTSLRALREAAAHCRGCDLYKDATQTVFGEGSARAKVLFVGEQPGDSEDKEGHPFVGPAGKLLSKALEEAGISRSDAYVTNAVKHFKFIWRGKRRIHQKPRRIEVLACTPWLEAEIRHVRPRVVVALGATAAQALLGSSFRLTENRRHFVESPLAPRVIATIHPSAILRAPDDAARRREMAEFVEDLKTIAQAVAA
ncbi:MAG: UdgX family uracil-DNA binding protein [Candidatus Eremiobacteraeota bacterium]|nr:UdgX family uracil-DNA binding protein [Candidatus Eremiobacteraeota bacterium]MBV9647408.1 UdgX family uracil-DNA binding protein [Candidatus Eremiobacteraeota bacterium]